ncbi:MAG: thioesterase family protein [Bdellovibrionota bacterium]
MGSGKKAPPSRGAFSFFHPLRVRWAEVDPQGIVFNANYFVYADVAVTEYFRKIGFAFPDGLARFGTDLFAVNASADFYASARFDAELDLGVRVARLGRTSFEFEVGVFENEKSLVSVSLTYVNATRDQSRAPTPLPEALVQEILSLEKTPPERK